MWYIGRKEVRRKSAKRRNYVPRAFYLPRQYLPFADGGIHHEGSGGEGRAFSGNFRFLSCYDVGGNRNDMYPPAKRMLTAMGVPFEKRKARRMTKADYEENDIIIGMDEENWRYLLLLTGGRKEKLHLLMDYTDRPGEVADPWYTGDFKETYRDILDGCRGLLAAIRKDEGI